MNDAQTWTLIGGFLTLMLTMIGLTVRTVRAEIGALGARFDGGFSTLEARIDHVDRDLQAVINRLLDG